MAKPLVTIITPAYNCEKYIAQCIWSVQSQDYKRIEHVIIDDGSTDGTLNICVDNAVDVVATGANQGEQRAVNTGLKQARGKYFMVLNADDLLMPGAISKLVAFMEANPDIVCAYPDWESINEDGSHRSYVTSREYDFKYMVRHHTCLPSVGSLVRSSVLKTAKRDENLRWLGDFVFWLKVALASPMARYPETLAKWRHSNGQASGQKRDDRAQEHIRVMLDFYSDKVPDEILEVKDEAMCWSCLVAAAVTDSKKRALLYINTALGYYPKVLLKLEFWHTVYNRAKYIIKR